MKIKDILQDKGNKVITTVPETTLWEALTEITENKVGSMVVLGESDQLLGIITERDVMRVIYQERDLKNETVGDHMTTEVSTGRPDDRIESVMDKMTQGRYRHMPVVENNELVGLVSIGDTVKAQLDYARDQVVLLREYIGGPVPN
tara:strand:+ start:122 stop:559 length:438 start_codon:yes stop_codon:yes gene_type:complete